MNNCLAKECDIFEEKLGHYFGRLISYPLIPPEHVYFSLTNRCNLRCKMCDIPKTPSKIEDELTTLKIKDIILQIKKMGIRHLIFSGGEPLLRNDLLSIVEFAIANNIEMVDVITNGILLHDNIIKRLIEVKLNHITISLDGLSETNNKVRGDKVFEKAEEAIDKFNNYKAKYNSSFPTVGINFTIMNDNIDDMLSMIEFARTKRCNIIVFQPVLFSNTRMYEKKRSILWASKDNIFKLKGIIKEIVSLKDKLEGLFIYTDTPILEVIPDFFEGKRPGAIFKCYEAIKRMVITYDGKLWSCKGIYGDLKQNTLKSIWFSKKATYIRNKVRNCKNHCLQDCVYFPSDILAETRKFLKKLEPALDEEKDEIKDRLLKKIEHYTQVLSTKLKSPLNFFKWLNFKKEIDILKLIRKEVTK